jgi:hypothetical protein
MLNRSFEQAMPGHFDECAVTLQEPEIERPARSLPTFTNRVKCNGHSAARFGQTSTLEGEFSPGLSILHHSEEVWQRCQQPGQTNGQTIVRVQTQERNPRLSLTPRIGSKIDLDQVRHSGEER